MPNTCTAYGCTNRSTKDSKEKGISFHQFPFNDKERLKQWIINIDRKNFKPSPNARLCSAHFLEEDFEYQLFTNRRGLKKTAVPTIFHCKEPDEPVRQRNAYDIAYLMGQQDLSKTTSSTKNEKCTQTDVDLMAHLLGEIQRLNAEVDALKSEAMKTELNPDNLDDNYMNIFTGFSKSQFEEIYSFLKDIDKQKLFIFFMRLKSGMTESMMGFFFKTSQSTISRAFTLITDLIYNKISTVGMWPDKKTVLENMPEVFKICFPECRVIVDCIEFPIQKPTNQIEQQLAFNQDKNTNTVKCLVGISPSGGISFISEGWGGSVSDSELFLKSGILELLEPEDVIIADRRFAIKEAVETKGCKVFTPDILKDKIQFNIIEKTDNRKNSRHRVHIERAILRIKRFKFFNGQISFNSLHSFSKLIYITAFFTNFGNSLVKC